MDTMITKILHQLGLNETEIKVYLMLLQTGTAPASTLAKRTDMPPSTARYTCKQLVQMGVVMMGVRGNTLLFTAREPENLSILLEKDRNILKRKEHGLNKILGDLQKLYNPYTTLPKVRFCEGVEGLISLLDDTLTTSSTIYGAVRFTSTTHKDITNYLEKRYIPARIKLKNKAFSLFNDTPETRSYRKRDDELNRTTLLIPEKNFPFAQCLQMYADRVAFYNIESRNPGGIIIQDANLKETQLSLFQMAWRFARQLEVNRPYKLASLDPS